MKKLLTSVSIASLLLPGLAFAAYNDVSLTTNASLSVNSITLNVSGSTAVIESIDVGATTLTVTLQSGSSFQVTAPNLNKLSTNQQLGLDSDLCNATASKIGYTASSTQIVAIITPSSDLCTGAAADTSGGTGSSRGGGGGGSPASQASPVAQTVTASDFSSLTPAEKQAVIAEIRTTLVSLIQQLIALLNQELAKIKASGTN